MNQTVALVSDNETTENYKKILGEEVNKFGDIIVQFCDECKTNIKQYAKFRENCLESLTFLSKIQHIKIDVDADAEVPVDNPSTVLDFNFKVEADSISNPAQSPELDTASDNNTYDFIFDPSSKRQVKPSERYSPPLKSGKRKAKTTKQKAKQKRNVKLKNPAIVRRRRPHQGQSEPKWCSLCSKYIGCHWVPHLVKVHLKELDFEVYKCRLCDKVLKKSVITHHFENHLTLKEPIDCELCGKKMFTLRSYRTHPERHVSYECHHCGKKLSTRKLILNHLLVIHFGAKRCYICSEIFHDEDEYQKHMVEERKNKKVKVCVCDLCGFTTKGTEMMWHHKHKKHSVADVICTECGKKCDNWVSYLEHRRNTHAERKQKCLLCDQRFVTKGLLRKHIEMRHTESLPVACDICGKTYTNKTVKKHQQHVHFKKYDLSCQVCGRAFKARVSLNKHMYRLVLKNSQNKSILIFP